MIPKVINYCWFGRNKKSELIINCIDSWKRLAPDYEIKEWNEDSFDVNCCRYVKESYDAGKWAFVSDYARFYVLFNYGGIYLDTDVELIKPIDEIIERGNFVACEPAIIQNVKKQLINPGLGMGFEKGHPLLKEMLNEYEKISLYKENGTIDLTTVVTRFSRLMSKSVFDDKSNQIQYDKEMDLYIYPSEYFCPMDDYVTKRIRISDNTISIHHYDGSWLNEEEKLAEKIREKLIRVMPRDLAYTVSSMWAYKKLYGTRETIKLVQEKIYNRLKRRKK